MTKLSPEALAVYEQLLDRMKRHDIDVPVLPEVARKVMLLVDDPDSDAAQMANVIHSDPVMAAHILRIGNSPAYTPSGNLVSLQQAISRLGMKTIANVAMTASVNSKMFHAPQFEKRIQHLWADALFVALWSKEVARLTHGNVDLAFLCGLLHSIGRPMLLQWLVDGFSSLTEDDMLAIEDQLFIEANRAVVDSWALPDAVLEGITSYTGDTASLPDMAKFVRAGLQMTMWCETPDKNPEDINDYGSALAMLNLHENDVDFLKMKFNDVNASVEIMRF